VDITKVCNFVNQLYEEYYQRMFDEIKDFFHFKFWDDMIIYVTVCPIVLGSGIAGHA
jgi:hypothetical protein